MRSRLDVVMLGVAALQVVAAILLILHPQFLLDRWPLPGTTDLTFTFLAAILAAAAASTAWVVAAGEIASFAGIALDYVAIFVPMAIYLLVIPADRGGGPSIQFVALVATAAFGAWLLSRSLPVAWRDLRETPRLVLVSFVVFVAALILAGGLLVANTPDVLPWQVTPEISVIAGLMFLGAAIYFAYALVGRGWSNAGGQLAGFLAYDLVLVLPFVARLPDVPDKWRLSLIVYTAVVVYSALLAAWFLFVAPGTRLRPVRAAAAAEASGRR